jgi:alkanesulfonate monooxygenase SsuD/methylene tetrahydromethanopterin reductase-like flavin-dependent oxidoreductase (luciferase family)
MLTFGLFLMPTRIHRDEDSAGLYDEMRDLAVLADQVGFDVVWTPEHHMVQCAQAPSCLLSAAAIGQHVRCRVGTAVALLPYRHPLIWAGEIAAADNLVGGRLELGVGRGAYKYEHERLGLDIGDSKASFQETLQAIVEQLSSEGSVAHQGLLYSYGPTFVLPRPVQRPCPPVWIAAQREETVRWGAERGYHVFNAPFLKPFAYVAGLAEAFREARQKSNASGEPRQFGVLRQGWVSEDEDELQELIHTVMMRQRMVSHLDDYDVNADDRAYVAPDPVPDEPSPEECMENLLWGTPDRVLQQVIEYEQAGVDHLIFSVSWGLPIERQLASLQLFADKVLTPYRERAGAAIGSASTG